MNILAEAAKNIHASVVNLTAEGLSTAEEQLRQMSRMTKTLQILGMPKDEFNITTDAIIEALIAVEERQGALGEII